jgi:hypothetical protein
VPSSERDNRASSNNSAGHAQQQYGGAASFVGAGISSGGGEGGSSAKGGEGSTGLACDSTDNADLTPSAVAPQGGSYAGEQRASSAGARQGGGGPANSRIEEEAINKLERLGYPREEILRQLKDDSSHLCKLYHRFLKALTAWDGKK